MDIPWIYHGYLWIYKMLMFRKIKNGVHINHLIQCVYINHMDFTKWIYSCRWDIVFWLVVEKPLRKNVQFLYLMIYGYWDPSWDKNIMGLAHHGDDSRKKPWTKVNRVTRKFVTYVAMKNMKITNCSLAKIGM